MSVLEIATFTIKSEEVEEFANNAQGAVKIISDDAGCRALELIQGIKEPDTFLIVIEWDSVGAHEAFRATEQFQEFVTAIRGYFAGPPSSLDYERRIVLKESVSQR